MRSKADTHSEEAEKAVRDIRRTTRRQYSAEEKVRIVTIALLNPLAQSAGKAQGMMLSVVA
jgi:hypothetical protein